MSRKFISAVIGSVLALGAWTTAEATFDIPACPPGEFTFLARDLLSFEARPQNSPPSLIGNALVSSDTGVARVRNNNTIEGTLIAKRIVLGTNAVVATCIADVIEGAGACTTVAGTFTDAPLACKQFAFTPPDVNLCVDVGLVVFVPPGQTESLGPGCYREIRVGLGATLNLEAGLYLFRNVFVQNGGTLNGVGPATNILVRNDFITGNGVTLSNFDINRQAAGQLQVFNDSVLDNVRLISAAGTVHIHTGSVGTNSVVAGRTVDMEPTTFSSPPPPPPILCVCPTGTTFAVEVCTPETTCQQARICVPE